MYILHDFNFLGFTEEKKFYGFGQHLKNMILVEQEQQIAIAKDTSDESVHRATIKNSRHEMQECVLSTATLILWNKQSCALLIEQHFIKKIKGITVFYDSVSQMFCLSLSCCSAEINLSPSLQQTKTTW